MPFYEYQCKNCGHALEAMQKISAAPLRKCPDCGKSQLVRLMSAPVFRLKGGGWYETDFKGDKDNQRNLADKPEVAETAKDTKDVDAKGKDVKGKDEKGKDDAKSTEAKGPEAVSAKDSPATKEKPADKPAEKSSAEKSPQRKSPAKKSPSVAARKASARRKLAKLRRRR
jgi:putative FmdB family regulatory protein